MTKEQFETEFRRLIDRVREAEVMPLEELTGFLHAELEGLDMAHEEGEAY